MSSRFLVAALAVACGVDGAQPRPPNPDGARYAPAVLAADLPPDAVQHELVRIDQPFHPNDDYRIVIDAWVTRGTLVDVRMGWVDTGADDARSRFGKGVRRHVDVVGVQLDPRSWRITLVSGDTRRQLVIALDANDLPSVSAMIDTDAGAARCRVTAGRLVARRVLGLAVGLERLEVECADGTRGTVRDGDPSGLMQG